jgi:PAS domain S-box-containing protein
MSENSLTLPTYRNHVMCILLLALCYAVVGRLSVLLAIPPGYATAIFPPAGIALVVLLLFGRRLAPGVFLGSFLLNIWIGHDSGADFIAGLPIAVGAATGAMLQALLACFLVRRFVQAPDELTRDTDIILFLLLAGPVACIVNASIGVGSLYLSNALAIDGVAYAWFTWWVGDSLGVLVSSPLLLIMLAPSRGVWRKRRWAVGLPLLLLSMALIWMFIKFSSWEVQQRQFEFREDVKITQEQLESRISRNTMALGALERFFSYSNYVSQKEFHGYANFFLQKDNEVKALSWNRYLTAEQRPLYEAQLQSAGVAHIFNLDTKPAPATVAEQYVVVEYIEPLAANSSVIGLNILPEPRRQSALLKARDSAELTATAGISLAQSGESAVLLFYPVYRQDATTVELRRQHIMGYITGVLAFQPLLESLLAANEGLTLEIRLSDLTDNGKVLYQSAALPRQFEPAFTQLFELNVGSRQWQIQYWPSEQHSDHNSDLLAFGVLTVGLLFTSILGAFLLVITGRAHHISQLVTQRSAELKGVLDNAIDTILTFDAKGRIDSINPAGERLLHYHRSSLLNQPVQLILPELEHQKYLAADDDAIQVRFDSFAKRSDDSTFAVEVALSKMAINGASRFTVILRDLTERHKAEKLKDDIISTVSHELRTPLTSILGSLGIVKSGVMGVLPEKAAELIDLAEQNSQRLTMLINDILELNKHQAEDYSQVLQPIALEAFLQKALALNAGYASRYAVELVLQSPSEPFVIAGDEIKLMQVMSNLLSNAIKYSPKQGVVTLSVQRHDQQYVDIAVQDHGNGIPEAFQSQVFQRFSQADSTDTRRVGGSGLGLAIAKIIVEKHHGQIWFQTAAKQGTTFFVRLPLHFG